VAWALLDRTCILGGHDRPPGSVPPRMRALCSERQLLGRKDRHAQPDGHGCAIGRSAIEVDHQFTMPQLELRVASTPPPGRDRQPSKRRGNPAPPPVTPTAPSRSAARSSVASRCRLTNRVKWTGKLPMPTDGSLVGPCVTRTCCTTATTNPCRDSGGRSPQDPHGRPAQDPAPRTVVPNRVIS
jgi:hypothetical protein